MWETIRWYTGKGFKKLSFGRTDLDHHGLLRFKREWGGDEAILDYHRYDMARSEFISSETTPKTSYAMMKKLPEPALRLIGTLLYRHVG